MKKIALSLVALSALTGSAFAASSSGAEDKTAAYYNTYGGGPWFQQSAPSDEAAFAAPSDTSDRLMLKRQGLDVQQQR